ncbi:hypothetical protein [Cognatishimia sp. WU-CL00825]|uniref:hypothetical protein n=1 Tax=Cognatishimia sp. WU-CL00825 TaxID=3127658 RepID=UPI003365359C
MAQSIAPIPYVFGQGDTISGAQALILQMYGPSSQCKAMRPTVVWFGTAPQGTDALNTEPRTLSKELVQQGYNLVVLNELKGHVGNSDAAKDALFWLSENAATLCHDPNKTILWGKNMGADLALETAYAKDLLSRLYPAPIAVVAISSAGIRHSHLRRGDPALFLVQGSKSKTLPPPDAKALAKAAHSRAIPVHSHQIIGGDASSPHLNVFDVRLINRPLIDHIQLFLEAAIDRKPYKSRATQSQIPK